MVLLNSASRSRNVQSLVNRNQGGGDKKAGFPYQVGRSSWTEIFFQSVDPVSGKCCKLKNYQLALRPIASISRPIGRNNNITYWHIPGTR